MLTVSGVVYISKAPDIRVLDTGAFFNLVVIGKNPYKQSREYYKIAVWVPKDALLRARERLIEGTNIWIRLGELRGVKVEDKIYMQDVKTEWKWIEILARTLKPERQ